MSKIFNSNSMHREVDVSNIDCIHSSFNEDLPSPEGYENEAWWCEDSLVAFVSDGEHWYENLQLTSFLQDIQL